jgi:hypothetical protein
MEFNIAVVRPSVSYCSESHDSLRITKLPLETLSLDYSLLCSLHSGFILILFSVLRIDLESGFFPPVFQTKSLNLTLVFPCVLHALH